jgi:hypothetical protein
MAGEHQRGLLDADAGRISSSAPQPSLREAAATLFARCFGEQRATCVISPGCRSVNAPDCVRAREYVMTDELNMSEHITRRAFQNAILSLATKRELEIWGGALIGRMDAQFETFQLHMDFLRRNMEAIRRDMQADLETMRSELHTHLARLEPARPMALGADGASQDEGTRASP